MPHDTPEKLCRRSCADEAVLRSETERSISARYLTKGFWAVADQGLFAVSNFALNVLLARWLSPHDYGAFGVAFAIFLLVGSLHTATLTEPMLVFGSGRYKERLPEYLGVLVYGHLGLAFAGSVVLALVGLALAMLGVEPLLSAVLLSLALAGPFILLLWLMRRACYARVEPRLAAYGGAWYMVLMLAGAYGLYALDRLSASSALGVMGISSLLVSLWIGARLRVKRPGKGIVRDSLEDHWRWGRWSVGSQALAWLPANIYMLVLPVWGGLEAGAAFKALMNLLMPMLQATTALSALLLPALVRAREWGGFGARLRLALFPLVLAPTLYWVFLGVLHGPLVSWLYGGRYTEYAGLLWLVGLVPVATAVRVVLAQGVKALERPDRLFWAFLVSALASSFLGVGGVYLWGIAGAGVGLLISQAIAAAVVAVLLLNIKPAPGPRAGEGR